MSEIQNKLKQGVVFVPAVVCYFKKDDEVLLGLRKKVSLGLGENLIAGIGGKIGDQLEFQDETPEEALIREVKEEIGVTITQFKKVGRVRFIYQDKPKWQQDVQVYIVEGWKGDPQETDFVKPLWFSITQLPTSKMWEDNTYWIPKVLAGENVDAIFLLDNDGKVIEYIFE